MAPGPLDLWNEWAIQILVLLSFTLQLVLVLLAGIRRRKAPAVLRILLWLAYQLADSTAIYAIGNLSLGGTPRDHQLAAFWAPLLLVHLGGPDNITAYSLEDSKLWLRHLLTVFVQVIGAAYVLYKHFTGSTRGNNSLMVATFMMFVVGVVKYGERTWALRSGNIDTIRSSLKKEQRTRCHVHIKRDADREEYLIRCAHALFHTCMYAVVDDSSDDSAKDTLDATKLGALWKDQEDMYSLMETELSLMYDVLYTKVSVIHTWIGYCIRIISPLATAASLLIFQLDGKNGQNKVDVGITYVLLTGAFLLEVTSLLRALGSSWTFTFLCAARWNWFKHVVLCSGRWHRLRHTIVSLHHLFMVMGISTYCIPSRRWSRRMGQYNMFHFCTRRDTSNTRPLLGRLANMLGQEDLWETMHYSGTIEIPEKVKELVFNYINRIVEQNTVNTLGVIRNNWGQQTMIKFQVKLDNTQLGAEFQEAVIIWHIATEIFLTICERAKQHNEEPTVEAIKSISSYMMFLLVDRPDMLPGLAQKRLYQRTLKVLCDIWTKVINDPTYHQPKRNVWTMLKQLFRLRENPNSYSSRPHRVKLVNKLLDRKSKEVDLESRKPESSRIIFAIDVTKKLQEEEEKNGRSLQMLAEMWIDFLVYASNRCSRESHAKKLSSGGELTTVLWLLTEHLYQNQSK